MVQTFCDVVALTTGTTGAAFGTAVNLTLNDQAKYIAGIVVTGCDSVITTAEGSQVLLRMQSQSLSKPPQVFVTGPYISSGPGTNSSGQGMVQDVIKLGWQAGPMAILTFDAALSLTNTTGKALLVQVIYLNDVPNSDWWNAFPDILGASGSAYSTITQATTTRTAMTVITIPKWAKRIIGARVACHKSGAITAAQYQQFKVDMQFSQAGVQPMILVSNSEGSTLGTPVGTGEYNDWLPFLPLDIPLTGTGDCTVTPYISLTAAVTNGPQCTVELLWK
jgi:hypothetical protein